MQSPIEIDYDKVPTASNELNFKTFYEDLEDVDLNYVPELNLLQIPYTEGILHFKDNEGSLHHYKSEMIEFHAPAEHVIDGLQPDLEM